jgi:tetratricopeptide (TPR) repeat protein
LTELNIQPESKRGAIYNAAIAFENAKQIGRAIQYRTLLTEDTAYSLGSDGKPTRESQLSAFALGRLFMNIGSYKRACEYFEQFGAKFQGEPDALSALNNAAIFREGLREYDQAVEDNRAYIGAAKGQLEKAQKSGLSEAQKKELRDAGRAETTDEFIAKKKIEIASAFFRIAKIREREGVPAKTKGAYEEYLKTYGKDGNLDDVLAAKGWLASNFWRERKRDETIKRCKEIIDAVDGLGVEKASKELSAGIDAAAECSFYVAERGYEIFESFKLPNNFDLEKIGEWVEGIKKSREDTSVLYQKVLKYGSKGWSLAALARIGEMSYRFMDGLYNAPLPEVLVYDKNGDGKLDKVKLTKAEREDASDLVRSKLDPIAEPIRGDAITAFDLCIKGATQNKWFNEWSQKCEEYLNKLSPSEYPLSAEWKSDPYKDELITVPAAVVTVLK